MNCQRELKDFEPWGRSFRSRACLRFRPPNDGAAGGFIFRPSFLLVLIVAPILARHRDNPNVQGFVKGAYAAAIGTILGACVLLVRIAIGDWLTALIGIVSLAILFRWKVSNPLLIAVTAVVGLIAFPLLSPTWVMVK